MDHPPPAPAPHAGPSDRIVAAIPGGIAGASFGLGFFSLCVFWWHPFSTILSSVGLAFGIFSLARGTRGPRGENIGLYGTALCAVSLSVALTLNQFLRYMMWDSL